MRILLITDNHTLSGGAENYFFDLKQRLKKSPEIEVHSLGFGPEEMSGKDFFILKGLKSKIFKLIWQVTFHPIIYFKLRKQIKKIQPDVIHLHNVKQYTASLLSAIKSYPVVQTIHDYSVICPLAQNIHKNKKPCSSGLRIKCFWQHQVKYHKLTYLALVYAFYKLKNKLKKNVSHFIAPSPLLMEYLHKNNFENANYIPPFKNDKENYSLDNINPFHFLFAGNLGEHKGLDILVDEFFLAFQKNNKITLTIAGKGAEEKYLKNKVKKLNLDKNIFFVGWQKKLETKFDECAALVFPSIGFEAFGLVMTEAMSHARAIIASDRSTSPWLIEDGKTGFIFNPLIKGDLAEKFLMLAGNVNLISQLGVNGYNKLNSLIDNEKTLEQIIDLYKSACRVD